MTVTIRCVVLITNSYRPLQTSAHGHKVMPLFFLFFLGCLLQSGGEVCRHRQGEDLKTDASDGRTAGDLQPNDYPVWSLWGIHASGRRCCLIRWRMKCPLEMWSHLVWLPFSE